MAIENGEAHGRCSVVYSAIKMAKPDWVRDKKINIIMQFGLQKARDLPDVPLALDFVTDPDDRQMLELLMGTTAIARPFMAPPGIPEARARALRRAFDETMKDPGFLAEAKQMMLDVEPTSGEEAQKIVEKMYATPRPTVERLKKLLGGG